MKNRIIFDLTDLAIWEGNLTGIQRVVYNIAIRIKNYHKFVIFVQYDQGLNKLLKVDLQEILTTRNSKLNKEFIAKQQTTELVVKLRKTNLYVFCKKYLPFWAKRLMVRIYSKYIKNHLKVVEEENITTNNKMEFKFKKDDIFLLLGALWVKSDYINYIQKIRLNTKINIHYLIYDLIPINFPYLFGPSFAQYFTNFLFNSITAIDNFISISKSTKKDLIKFNNELNFKNKNINVIRLGDEINKSNMTPFHSNLKLSNYLLSVGTIESRKNYELIYITYKMANSLNINLPKIIIVGRYGWLTENIKYKIENDKYINNKIFIKYDVSDDELDYLYKNCLFTIYPSIYEGWGLPIAESLSYGKFCLASETSSMPEIGGSLLEYFNPYNPKQLLDLITKYLDPILRKNAEDKIKNNYKITSWDDTTKQIYDIINKSNTRAQ